MSIPQFVEEMVEKFTIVALQERISARLSGQIVEVSFPQVVEQLVEVPAILDGIVNEAPHAHISERDTSVW